jgi:hypothetical protein
MGSPSFRGKSKHEATSKLPRTEGHVEADLSWLYLMAAGCLLATKHDCMGEFLVAWSSTFKDPG